MPPAKIQVQTNNKVLEFDKVVASIDCDGCGEYIFHQPNVKPKNRTLDLPAETLNKHPLIKQLQALQVSTLLNGSLRQCLKIDFFNAQHKNAPLSWWRQLDKIAQHLGTTLNPMSIADIQNGQELGYSYKNLPEELINADGKYSLTGNVNRNLTKIKNLYGNMLTIEESEDKITMLYAQLQQIGLDNPNKQVGFALFDDLYDVGKKLLKNIHTFFSRFPQFIPKNVTLLTYHYSPQDQVHAPVLKNVITGSGESNKNYKKTVIALSALDAILATYEATSDFLLLEERQSIIESRMPDLLDTVAEAEEKAEAKLRTAKNKAAEIEAKLKTAKRKRNEITHSVDILMRPMKEKCNSFGKEKSNLIKEEWLQQYDILKKEVLSEIKQQLSDNIFLGTDDNLLKKEFAEKVLSKLIEFQTKHQDTFNKHRNPRLLVVFNQLCEGLWRLLVASIPFARLIGDLSNGNPVRCDAKTAMKHLPVIGVFSDNGLCGKTESVKTMERAKRRLEGYIEKQTSLTETIVPEGKISL